jgi:hypothetical protein
MFGSNVAPRVKKVMRDAVSWLCASCGCENAHYMNSCGVCNKRRRT